MTDSDESQNQDNTPTLASRVREGRERAGLNLRDAAALVGIHYSVLGRIEAGEVASPAPRIVQSLADVLELDYTEMFGFIGIRDQVPEPKMYFRKAYNLNDEDAEAAAQQVEAIIASLRAHHHENDKDNQATEGGKP
jgi:transcriptional regulator with XRE-family HTH domain